MKIKREPQIDVQQLLRDDHEKVQIGAPTAHLGTEEQVAKLLLHDDGPKPYCTCGQSGSFSFDQQLGVFVHVSDKTFCYKPSKAYYRGAVEAGIIRE